MIDKKINGNIFLSKLVSDNDANSEHSSGLVIPDTSSYTSDKTISTLDDCIRKVYINTQAILPSSPEQFTYSSVYTEFNNRIETYEDMLDYVDSCINANSLLEAQTNNIQFYSSGSQTLYYFVEVKNSNNYIIYKLNNNTVLKQGDLIIPLDSSYPTRWFGNFNGSLEARRLDPNQEADIIETTYADLVALRLQSKLIPGRFYRITDYQCTTTCPNTSSAGHQFDIIVRADSINKLSEEASAILHIGTTYFSNCKLEAWKLWYCLDNNVIRFEWADPTNGKGVIYRMIDEWGNDVPYDFKNILFTKSGKYTNAYTFSYTQNGSIKDESVLATPVSYCNIIRRYTGDGQRLNFNVFYSTSSSLYCHNNIFNFDCHDNTISRSASENSFEQGCYNIQLGSWGVCNKFGAYCHDIITGDSFNYNSIGTVCYDLHFGEANVWNEVGCGCSSIYFGNSDATINQCAHNIIDTGCKYLNIISTDTEAIFTNQLQNVHIHLGVSGTSSNQKIITIPDRNLPYETNIYAANSTDIILD